VGDVIAEELSQPEWPMKVMTLAQRTCIDVANVESVSIQLIAAIVLAVVFGVSATAKSREMDRTRSGIDALTSTSMPFATAHVLVATETLVAVGLVLPRTRELGALAALGLLAIFSALIVRSLTAGRKPVCFCFGSLSTQPLSSLDLYRNGALAVLAVVTLVA
jgi:uncharacterized membrane protein YphA (DoxX/SURF4 family)